VLPTIPTAENTMQGASILSADCLSIAAQSQYKKQAETFIRFLTEYRNSKRFSIAVPDAGFPADTAIINDNELQNNPLRKGFLQQTYILCHRLLHLTITAEAIFLFEKEIMYAFYKKKTPEQALADAKKEYSIIGRANFPKKITLSVSFIGI
jgi:maltose-binding protein MalE